MAIKDILKDVLKHTHGLGIFEMVKITGDVEKATIETVDADKTVIFKGETHQPYPDFVDSTVGLSRMGVLQGYLQYPGFDGEGSTITVKTQERNNETVPVEVEFTRSEMMHIIDLCYQMLLTNNLKQLSLKVLSLT